MTLGDLDLDGNMDAAIVGTTLDSPPASGAALLLHGTADGSFTLTGSDLVWIISGASVGIGRFDGDDFPDVIVGVAHRNTEIPPASIGEFRFYKGDGSTDLGAPVTSSDGAVYRDGVAIGDLNEDGFLDAVQAIGPEGSAFWIGQGDGTFLSLPGLTTSRPSGIAVGDFDGDTTLDIVISDALEPFLTLKRGGACCTELVLGGRSSSVLAVDLDADSRLDLVMSNHMDNTVSLVMGRGDGTFEAPVTLPTGVFPQDVATGDWNGDALMDLAIVNAGSESVTLYYQGNPTIVGVEPPASGISLSAPYPSPTRGVSWADVTLGGDDAASLEILDVRGRVVSRRTLSGEGTQTVALFGGGGLRPGVYWLRLSTERAGALHPQVRKFVVLE
jgi:hypothetical protein